MLRHCFWRREFSACWPPWGRPPRPPTCAKQRTGLRRSCPGRTDMAERLPLPERASHGTPCAMQGIPPVWRMPSSKVDGSWPWVQCRLNLTRPTKRRTCVNRSKRVRYPTDQPRVLDELRADRTSSSGEPLSRCRSRHRARSNPRHHRPLTRLASREDLAYDFRSTRCHQWHCR